ncbi:M48 family metallopeptidase [Stappia taiwanensis]|uniref:M48 family metallopeptidase n=1 Tax=Stappia taiwanensis TaxID=992267 RepID=UPI001AD94BA3|nr:SprT family zinc-dependent metalloprotease [Stappia taiwanensis]
MRRLLARLAPEPLPDQLWLTVNGERQAVRLKRNDRAKRYILRLPAGGDPVLTVPARGTLETARRFAEEHRGWLADRLTRRPESIPFTDGAVIPLRGAPHRVVAGARLRGLVTLRPGEPLPEIEVPGDPRHLARKLTDWLKREARRDLEQAVAVHTARLGRSHAGLSLKDTRSRWGSCTATGRLSFSWRLVLAPPEILDYVAAHEVAHLAEMNHGPRFWELCRFLAPQTDDARLWLRREGAGLHLYG